MEKMILENRTGFSKSLFMAAIVLLSVSFVACNKDDDDKNPNGYKITAQVVNGNSDVAAVKAILDGDVLAGADFDTSTYGFTILLPDPDEYYLEELGFADGEGCVLDGFLAYDKKGKTIGQFGYAVAQSSDAGYLGMFVYTTEDFKVTGTAEGVDVNISGKKGWNIVYGYFDFDGEIIALTSQRPNGMMWIYIDDTSLLKQSGAAPDTGAIKKLNTAISKKLNLKISNL
ncbi:MAG: hypothetical protein LBC47_03790 [Tannerella sp.]|jgi:hypothetical protein|nr:hypothetical protein [Tannerella sp.]